MGDSNKHRCNNMISPNELQPQRTRTSSMKNSDTYCSESSESTRRCDLYADNEFLMIPRKALETVSRSKTYPLFQDESQRCYFTTPPNFVGTVTYTFANHSRSQSDGEYDIKLKHLQSISRFEFLSRAYEEVGLTDSSEYGVAPKYDTTMVKVQNKLHSLGCQKNVKHSDSVSTFFNPPSFATPIANKMLPKYNPYEESRYVPPPSKQFSYEKSSNSEYGIDRTVSKFSIDSKYASQKPFRGNPEFVYSPNDDEIFLSQDKMDHTSSRSDEASIDQISKELVNCSIRQSLLILYKEYGLLTDIPKRHQSYQPHSPEPYFHSGFPGDRTPGVSSYLMDPTNRRVVEKPPIMSYRKVAFRGDKASSSTPVVSSEKRNKTGKGHSKSNLDRSMFAENKDIPNTDTTIASAGLYNWDHKEDEYSMAQNMKNQYPSLFPTLSKDATEALRSDREKYAIDHRLLTCDKPHYYYQSSVVAIPSTSEEEKTIQPPAVSDMTQEVERDLSPTQAQWMDTENNRPSIHLYGSELTPSTSLNSIEMDSDIPSQKFHQPDRESELPDSVREESKIVYPTLRDKSSNANKKTNTPTSKSPIDKKCAAQSSSINKSYDKLAYRKTTSSDNILNKKSKKIYSTAEKSFSSVVDRPSASLKVDRKHQTLHSVKNHDPVSQRTSNSSYPASRKTSIPAPVSRKTSIPAPVSRKTSIPAPVSRKTSIPTPVSRKTSISHQVTSTKSKPYLAQKKDTPSPIVKKAYVPRLNLKQNSMPNLNKVHLPPKPPSVSHVELKDSNKIQHRSVEKSKILHRSGVEPNTLRSAVTETKYPSQIVKNKKARKSKQIKMPFPTNPDESGIPPPILKSKQYTLNATHTQEERMFPISVHQYDKANRGENDKIIDKGSYKNLDSMASTSDKEHVKRHHDTVHGHHVIPLSDSGHFTLKRRKKVKETDDLLGSLRICETPHPGTLLMPEVCKRDRHSLTTSSCLTSPPYHQLAADYSMKTDRQETGDLIQFDDDAVSHKPVSDDTTLVVKDLLTDEWWRDSSEQVVDLRKCDDLASSKSLEPKTYTHRSEEKLPDSKSGRSWPYACEEQSEISNIGHGSQKKTSLDLYCSEHGEGVDQTGMTASQLGGKSRDDKNIIYHVYGGQENTVCLNFLCRNHDQAELHPKSHRILVHERNRADYDDLTDETGSHKDPIGHRILGTATDDEGRKDKYFQHRTHKKTSKNTSGGHVFQKAVNLKFLCCKHSVASERFGDTHGKIECHYDEDQLAKCFICAAGLESKQYEQYYSKEMLDNLNVCCAHRNVMFHFVCCSHDQAEMQAKGTDSESRSINVEDFQAKTIPYLKISPGGLICRIRGEDRDFKIFPSGFSQKNGVRVYFVCCHHPSELILRPYSKIGDSQADEEGRRYPGHSQVHSDGESDGRVVSVSFLCCEKDHSTSHGNLGPNTSCQYDEFLDDIGTVCCTHERYTKSEKTPNLNKKCQFFDGDYTNNSFCIQCYENEKKSKQTSIAEDVKEVSEIYTDRKASVKSRSRDYSHPLFCKPCGCEDMPEKRKLRNSIVPGICDVVAHCEQIDSMSSHNRVSYSNLTSNTRGDVTFKKKTPSDNLTVCEGEMEYVSVYRKEYCTPYAERAPISKMNVMTTTRIL